MRATKEWGMVAELYRVRRKMFDNQKKFITTLYNHLDEFAPFLNEQSDDQLEYLRTLYKIYIK